MGNAGAGGAGAEPKDRDGTVAGTAVLLHSRKQEYCPAQSVRCHLKHMDQYPCSSCKLERDTEQPDEGNRDPGSDKDGNSRAPSRSSWEPGQAHSCAPQTLQGRKNCLT